MESLHFRLEGHEAEVTCVEWCSNDFRLVTCGDDMKHRTWRLVNDKSKIDPNDISGEAKLISDVQYVDPPHYASTLSVNSNEAVSVGKTLSTVKRQIFGNDENNRNVENQLASIRYRW